MKKVILLLSIICVISIGLNVYMLISKVNTPKEEIKEPPKEEKKEEVVSQLEPEDVIIQDEIEEEVGYDNAETEAEYDVIVFGAEPEGITAAISAARNKLKVLLVEEKDGPGGLMTYGMLNTIDMNTDKDGQLLSKGIFEEFYKKVDNRTSFDVDVAKKAFEEMLDTESNITQMYNAKEITVKSDKTKIEYAVINNKKYVAKFYIDCTQDADISAMAGAKYTIGWEDINEKNRAMSATLVIKMDGFDWDKACEAIRKQNIPNTGYTDDSIWAFRDITEKYVPKQTHMRLKGLNIGRQNDGSILINSLQIMNVNMLDKEVKKDAYAKCAEEAEYVAKFLKENVPGFENAKLVSVAPELYVRETRHIVGEAKLTVTDILESRYYSNAIAMAAYPIDLQTTSIYDWGYVIGNPEQYYIQMGVIIPKGYTNLLTVGRASSYTSIAAGSARVIPTGMTLAESAGIMTAVAIDKNVDYQELLANRDLFQNVKLLMDIQGMRIDTASRPVVDTKAQYYSFIIEMCEKGILSLGYSNEFNAEEIISEKDFIVLFKTYLKRNFLREDLWNTDHINLLDVSEDGITPNRMKEIMYDISTYNLKEEDKKRQIDDFLNLVLPTGSERLNIVRVYEIIRNFKDFIVKNEI